MHFYILLFALGISSILCIAQMPSFLWMCAITLITSLCGLSVIFYRNAYLRGVLIFLLGFIFAAWHVQWRLAYATPHEEEGKILSVQGVVDTIPDIEGGVASFEFIIQKVFNNVLPIKLPLRVRLSWINPWQEPMVGNVYHLTIRLKRPHGYANLGGFDYERWLFEHNIRATGYVVANSKNQKIAIHSSGYWLALFREHLDKIIIHNLADSELKGFITALVLGIRHGITVKQWQVMQNTGTNHLLAIAGLHIGFVAGMMNQLCRFLWTRSTKLMLLLPVQQAAAVAALCAGLMYSALAGFALPTQRAVIMLTVFMLSVLTRRHIAAWNAWFIALIFILILDPLAILSDSFWLSFGAVAVIIYGMSGRLAHGGWWWKWGRVQWVVALGLIPLTLLFFHQISAISFFANAMAIPWVGFLVLPLSLLGGFASLFFPHAGLLILQAANYLLKIIWLVLQWFASLHWAQWQHFIFNNWILLCSLIAVILILAPRGLSGRWLSLIWSMPLCFWLPERPGWGSLHFTLLDVGQGLSTVVNTQAHTLVFDTGPHYKMGIDAGQAVLVPFLQAIGIRQVDQLVISHDDNDHIGGSAALLASMPVKNILSSTPEAFSVNKVAQCLAGQRWQWDGVLFEILSPPKNYSQSGNNSSCVLRVSTHTNSILLPGDIEKKSERYLVEHQAQFLPATFLVAPHHGSKTSSSLPFINKVQAKYVFFATGYRNRYHLPNASIMKRYQAIGVKYYNTASCGAISFGLSGSHKERLGPFCFRQNHQHIWN